MSLEAITSVTKAEQEAKAALEAARAKADSELELLRVKAEEKSKTDAENLTRDLESEQQALRRKAEEKLDAAAALIVERIVND